MVALGGFAPLLLNSEDTRAQKVAENRRVFISSAFLFVFSAPLPINRNQHVGSCLSVAGQIIALAFSPAGRHKRIG